MHTQILFVTYDYCPHFWHGKYSDHYAHEEPARRLLTQLNPRTLTMGVIHPEEFYGGHFQIDLPLSGGFQSKELLRILRGLI